jgi:hypothetical protein
MSSIYAYAASVTIWLGGEANESSEVFDLLRLASNSTYRGRLWKVTEDGVFVDYTKRFLALLERPWFRRIWVSDESRLSTGELC